MNPIPGYTLTTPVCEAGGLILYQATRALDGLPVLLKVPASARPASALLHRLEREYELASIMEPEKMK
jgi:hypothetical protein